MNRLRNLAQKIKLVQRKDDDAEGMVEIQTAYGRAYELRELKPYGLASKPESGNGLCLFIGGEVRSPVLLPLAETKQNAPKLSPGEVALYSKNGNFVLLREDGSIEINGTDFGGLIKWSELEQQLTKINTLLQNFQQVLKVPVNEPGNGSPSVLQTALKAALGGSALPDYSNVESDAVQHGKGAKQQESATSASSASAAGEGKQKEEPGPKEKAEKEIKEDVQFGLRFSSPDKAAIHWARRYLAVSIKYDLEFGSTIYEMQDEEEIYYVYTRPAVGKPHGVSPSWPIQNKHPDVAAYIHTHGAEDAAPGDETFSGRDIGYAEEKGLNGYLVTPSGVVKKYEHKTANVVVLIDIDPNTKAKD